MKKKISKNLFMTHWGLTPLCIMVALFCALPLSLYADDEDEEKNYEGEPRAFTLYEKSQYDSGKHSELGQPSSDRNDGLFLYTLTSLNEQTAKLQSIQEEKLDITVIENIPSVASLSHINPYDTHNDSSADPHAGHTFQFIINEIMSTAFQNLENLEEITIANHFITKIPSYLFMGSKNLKSVTIGGAVNKIDGNIFDGCDRLEKLRLGHGVKTINNQAFNGAINLKDIYVEWRNQDEIPDIIKDGKAKDIFPYDKNTGNITATLHVPIKYADQYQGSEWEAFKNKEFDNDFLHYTLTDDGLSVYVSSGKEDLKLIEVPDHVIIDGRNYSVKGIGKDAFKDNKNVTSVVLPETITFIEEGAFSGCSGISELTSYNPIPPQITVSAASTRGTSVASQFEGINKETCILFVPKGSVEAYRNSYGWGDFNIILEIEGNSTSTGIVIKPMHKEDDKDEAYYNLCGQRVKTPSKGLYIKKGKKILIK